MTAREALEKYGVHPSSCPKGRGIGHYVPRPDAICTCGIDGALGEPELTPYNRKLLDHAHHAMALLQRNVVAGSLIEMVKQCCEDRTGMLKLIKRYEQQYNITPGARLTLAQNSTICPSCGSNQTLVLPFAAQFVHFCKYCDTGFNV